MVAINCTPLSLAFFTAFTGNVLHIVNVASPTGSPIITMPRASPSIQNQMWEFAGINGPENNEGLLLPEGLEVFLSADSTSDLQYRQASGQTLPTIFSLTNCINSTAGALTANDLALTAWPLDPARNFTPVTFETFTADASQIWSFVPA
ncbi:hypothetical protein B0H16DRAFT_1893439 [Mycena metata]|uniref:Ricin B lectin domain-containing protein n=1 Tax=Mycena metata TaxID=1033252 RepID=A0AAD7HZ75_9AGAR|nr:hypothetical protein B0H16DRAFT_1893439 [Mycena metata]